MRIDFDHFQEGATVAVDHWEPAPRRFLVYTLKRGVNDPVAYGVTFNHGPTVVVENYIDPFGHSGTVIYPDHKSAEKRLPEGRVEWLDGWYPNAESEIERLDWWIKVQGEIRRNREALNG